MKFAEKLTRVKTLLHYDIPLLEHWVDVDGRDFLMILQDETPDNVAWLAVHVAPSNLAALMQTELAEAITLRELLLREDLLNRIYLVRKSSYVYDAVEGEQISVADLGDNLPAPGSYINTTTYLAWQETQ